MKVHRIHDKLYLNEEYKNKPKETFKFVTSHIDQDLEGKNILDVGCATGDFIWFLMKNSSHCSFSGMDVDDDLLDKAKLEVLNSNFYKSSIDGEKSQLPNEKFDVITMLGVNSIFDTLEWLDNVIHLLKNKKSKAYIYGLFNPENYDVLLKVRPSSSETPWESGWNMISKKTMIDYLEKKGMKCSFYDFSLEIDIEKNLSDPLRSWTERMKDGSNLVVNGTQLVHKTSLLKIQYK